MRLAGFCVALLALVVSGTVVQAQLFGSDAPAPRKPSKAAKAKPKAQPKAASPAKQKAMPPAAAAAAALPAAAAAGIVVPPAPNNGCRNTGSFEAFMADFRREAAAAGIKPATIQSVLGNLTLDQAIISRDRHQSFFSQTFIDFSSKLATNNRLQNGIAQVKKHAAVFARAEKEYGVPPAVIAAFWALESDFGSAPGMGKHGVLRSLATLAYDCRRGPMFRGELLAALKIIDRGDLTAEEMTGSWAGELGQTQFLPSHYFNYAVDYDGDGRRDLYRSIPDVIGSSANFVAQLGWKRGEPWLEEVRVPDKLAWEQADLAVQHPRSKWAAWGVTQPDGRPIANDNLPASLLLLQGRHGPAFLVYPNFQVYLKWNQSLTYCTTAAYLATRIQGARAMSHGNGPLPVALSFEQMKELQVMLAKRGYKVGEADGKLGSATRLAVKAMQVKLGLPADSYPTAELLDAMRRSN
jgi:lytic murein transglycosylase